MSIKNKLKNIWCFIERPSRNIKLVDKCLIIFMMIIMAQIAFSLFANEVREQEAHLIDVVIRTAAAGIFGYFLSANFIRENDKRENDENGIPINHMVGGEGEFITDSEAYQDTLLGICTPAPAKKHTQNEQQIIIATAIGVMSFIILIMARNFVELTPASIGTISQLRDFFSGSVGFLLGTPSNTDNN